MSDAWQETAGRMATHWERDRAKLSARIAELEAERKALCAAMNSAAGEIVNGAGRHKIANELLSPDAVLQWLKADDEECERAARVEAELAETQAGQELAVAANLRLIYQRNEAREQARQLREAFDAWKEKTAPVIRRAEALLASREDGRP